MKLKTMEIINFRQFYGSQHIEFAGGENGRNVTVFHGFNGAGKTALLNSFVWCLYGETTKDFESNHLLANERAVAEAEIGATVNVTVTLEFEHKYEDYRISRTRRAHKVEPGKLSPHEEQLTLQKIATNGELEAVVGSDESRQRRIHQILPPELYRFFFFNGERVEYLASADAFAQVQQGVKTLLDVELYERGHRHLMGDVQASVRDDLKRSSTDEGKKLLEELSAVESELAAVGLNREQATANIEARRREVADIEQRQREIKELAELAHKRDDLESKKSRAEEEIANIRHGLAQAISRNGYLAFAGPALAAAETLISDARVRGDIPAKIKPQFVDDLLTRARCICGRLIGQDSPEAHALHTWRGATGLAELEERISHLSAVIPGLRKRREELYEALQQGLERLQVENARRRQFKDELSVIGEQMGNENVLREHAALQSRVVTLRNEDIRDQALLLKTDEDLTGLLERQKKLKADSHKIVTKEEQGRLAQKRLGVVERVAGAFKAIADYRRDEVRAALDRQIRETWRDAAIKDYDAELTPEYQLKLTKMVGGSRQDVQGASTGEKQVLALSFVASLVKKARDSISKHMNIDLGAEYPLVMDSPFGSLEDEYRSKVAEWVPRLSKQVVVMASKSQWRHEVETAMRAKIGKEYVLELHTPKSGSDRTVTIDGEERPYVVQSTEPTEYTQIRKV
jgi:DNA sulfur modification protein DndD